MAAVPVRIVAEPHRAERGAEEEQQAERGCADLFERSAEPPPENEARIVQAALHRSDWQHEDAGDLQERQIHEVVQHHRLLHLRRQGADGVAQKARVHRLHHTCRAVVGGFGEVAWEGDGTVGLAPRILGVAVYENLAHPAEEGGMLVV